MHAHYQNHAACMHVPNKSGRRRCLRRLTHLMVRSNLLSSAPMTSPVPYVGPYRRPEPEPLKELPSSPWYPVEASQEGSSGRVGAAWLVRFATCSRTLEDTNCAFAPQHAHVRTHKSMCAVQILVHTHTD